MCRRAMSPAAVPAPVSAASAKIACRAIRAFGGVGVFGVELFWMPDGRVVVNEIAPRVHNSGHVTMNACATGQFEQHWRAILGLPLGDTRLIAPAAAMVNIIGRRKTKLTPGMAPMPDGSFTPRAWVHWYNKSGPAYERKIGHVNALADTPKKAIALAMRVRDRVRI